MKQQALAKLLACVILLTPAFIAADQKKQIVLEDGKKPFIFETGDCSLKIAGKTKVENYFDRNIALLNKSIPDEFLYFKNTFDISFDFAYGQKTFGHDAVKAYTAIRHKGIWGRGAVFADSDAMSPAPVKLSDSFFGQHSHTSGKPLMWIYEAWLQFSLNAIANVSPERLHTIKMGWFPFELGRGISLGAAYGINRENLGLNSYAEDKGAPGILWHGVIKKDTLSYDLYYAVFECRSKSLGDTLNLVKEQHVGRKLSPWRGLGKNNEIFAARLKWKPVNNKSHGSWEFEPYAFFLAASDQKVRIIADSNIELGTIGMAVEHKGRSGFEFGIEGAFNLGDQKVQATDQNKIEIARNNDGFMVEQFSHIQNTSDSRNSRVNDASKEAAKQIITNDNTPLATGFKSKPGRILPDYVNKYRGYMVVTDMSQKFDQYDLTLAAAYGFASGDEHPHEQRKCKTHMGFVGVHEVYTGKRVSSVLFLDAMRSILSIPGAVSDNVNSVDNNELAFTNLHILGCSAKWTPMVANKRFTFNPNMLFFWRALAPNKFDTVANQITGEKASRFIGSEFNLKTNIQLLKDLNLFGNFGLFIPGKMFTDIKGIPFKNAFAAKNDTFFDMLHQHEETETDTLKQSFGLGTDIAYHMNIGFSYSF